MSVSIFEGPGVSKAVLDEEFAIIADEGWYHVDGQYKADLTDAAIERRRVAKRRVRDRQRFARWAAMHPQEMAA